MSTNKTGPSKRLQGQRWVSLVIDCSEAMKDGDMPPNRLLRLLYLLPAFIYQFFDVNPLSQLQIIQTSDGVASIISPMSGMLKLRKLRRSRVSIKCIFTPSLRRNPDGHMKAIRDLASGKPLFSSKTVTLYNGSLSIQNSIIAALESHKYLPRYGSKQILMILGGLGSQDPSNPAGVTLQAAISSHTSISFIHLAAEMYVCKQLSSETGGFLVVPLHEQNLLETLDNFAKNGTKLLSNSSSSDKSSADNEEEMCRLLLMGFPKMESILEADSADSGEIFEAISELCQVPDELKPRFTCPKCYYVLPYGSSLPSNCPLCKLMLVKLSQIARSYHHLFPSPQYLPVTKESLLNNPELDQIVQSHGLNCYGCQEDVVIVAIEESSETQKPEQISFTTFQPDFSAVTKVKASAFLCSSCNKLFCKFCEEGTFQYLHQCLGCLEMHSS